MRFLKTRSSAALLPARILTGSAVLNRSVPRFYAQQSYGGGEGDPKGEKPQDQGPNPSSHLEHPGPEPPTVGGKSEQSKSSSSSQDSGSKTGGAQPKIHSKAPPTEENDDVKKHNEDMSKRYDKAQEQSPQREDDKVGKGFWKGQGGADRNP